MADATQRAVLLPFDRWGADTVLLCLGLEEDGWAPWSASASATDADMLLAAAVCGASVGSLFVLGHPEDLARCAWPDPVCRSDAGTTFAVPMRCRHRMAQEFARERQAVDGELRGYDAAAVQQLTHKKGLVWVDAALLVGRSGAHGPDRGQQQQRWRLAPRFESDVAAIVAAIRSRSHKRGRR